MNTLQPHPITRAEWRDYFALTLLGSVLLSFLIYSMLPLNYQYSNDTAGYIQEAQNLLRGKGFLRGTGWSDTTRELAPFPLFPPGYAIEIAGLSKLGLSLPHAALIASWAAWLLLLPAISYAVRPLIGRAPAMAVALLSVSSLGFVEWGYLALSDSGMILFSVLSLGVLLRQDCSRSNNWRSIFLSGLLAGWAYILRNAAAVLPLTVISFLGLSSIARQLAWRAAFRSALSWGAGFAVLSFPLFLYNLYTFGSIQPYFDAHGTTDFGVLRSFRLSLWSFLLDISAWSVVAKIAWSAVAMALLLLPAMLLLILTGWHRWRDSLRMERSALLLLLLYMNIGFAMIVWGRSHFDWVELNLTRQFMPYSWVALTAATWSLHPASASAGKPMRIRTGVLLAAGLLLLGGRIDGILTNLQREAEIQKLVDSEGLAAAATLLPGIVLTNRIKQNASRDRVLLDLLKALPSNAHIISNFGSVLSLESGRHIRSFDLNTKNIAELLRIRAHLSGKPLILVLIPTNVILRSPTANTWQDDTLREIGSEYETLLKTSTVLVLRIL